MHNWSDAPMHDLALMGLIVMFVGVFLGVRILWDIYKVAVGFWKDYRRVNRLDDWPE
jgi:hypothetical protein